MFQEEVKSKSNPEEQMVGRCFLQHSETMKAAYTEYCINHDKAEQLLEKYDQIQVCLLTYATKKAIGRSFLNVCQGYDKNRKYKKSTGD